MVLSRLALVNPSYFLTSVSPYVPRKQISLFLLECRAGPAHVNLSSPTQVSFDHGFAMVLLVQGEHIV